MDFLLKALIFIIMFSTIVLVHEGGHFLLGKRAGIGVVEFFIGFGPTIWSFDYNGTKFSLKLLPFGGACMFEGEDGDTESPSAFPNATVWNRIATVVAGPVCNFILAYILSLFVIGSVGFDAPIISDVMPGYPAQEAGMQAGDEIVRLGNRPIHLYRDISAYTLFFQGRDTEVQYRRDGKIFKTTLVPQYDPQEERYLFGFMGSIGRHKGTPIQVMKYSIYEVRYWIHLTYESLGMIFQGRVTKDDVAGPVGVAQVVGEVYDEAKPDGAFYIWLNMFNIAILLTANLGVMNLLPLPALDGGRLVFLLIEAIRGKPIDPEKEAMVHFAGFMVLLALMVLIMFNDVSKFFR